MSNKEIGMFVEKLCGKKNIKPIDENPKQATDKIPKMLILRTYSLNSGVVFFISLWLFIFKSKPFQIDERPMTHRLSEQYRQILG